MTITTEEKTEYWIVWNEGQDHDGPYDSYEEATHDANSLALGEQDDDSEPPDTWVIHWKKIKTETSDLVALDSTGRPQSWPPKGTRILTAQTLATDWLGEVEDGVGVVDHLHMYDPEGKRIKIKNGCSDKCREVGLAWTFDK